MIITSASQYCDLIGAAVADPGGFRGFSGKPLLNEADIRVGATCLQCWRTKRLRRKLPSYSSLNCQEMPLSFKHNYICRNSLHHAAFLEASVYAWHGPNIHVSESNVYRRAIPAMILFPGRLFFYLQFDAKNNCFSKLITWTSQTRPRIDGVRKSVPYSIYHSRNQLKSRFPQ